MLVCWSQIDIFLGVTAPIIFILLMGANPVSVFVPVGSTLLAASFVFARSMQDLMTCVVFVLMQHPYDVGDVVRVWSRVPGPSCAGSLSRHCAVCCRWWWTRLRTVCRAFG